MRRRKTFEAIEAEVRELVLAHAPETITIEKAERIASDVAYLIWRGHDHQDATKHLNECVLEQHAELDRLRKVKTAAEQLYLATPGRFFTGRQGGWWKNLRDALGLKPGSATKAGVGA